MRLDDLNTGAYRRGDWIAAALALLGVEAGDAPVFSRDIGKDAGELFEVWVPTDLGLVIAQHEIKRGEPGTSEARITDIVPWPDADRPAVIVTAWRDRDRDDGAFIGEVRVTFPRVGNELRAVRGRQDGDPRGLLAFTVEYLRRVASSRS